MYWINFIWLTINNEIICSNGLFGGCISIKCKNKFINNAIIQAKKNGNMYWMLNTNNELKNNIHPNPNKILIIIINDKYYIDNEAENVLFESRDDYGSNDKIIF